MSKSFANVIGICIVLVLLPMLALINFGYSTFVEKSNFRLVTSDLYRSGQLRLAEWNSSFKEHPFKSILNLRGENKQTPWYDFEVKFADEHQIEHYNFAISAKTAPTRAEMEAIVKIMRLAPKPLLVHCNSGSDRSGLASALYVYSVNGAQAELARQQLSLWYGHLPWFRKSAAMDRALSNFVADHPAASLTTLTDLHVGRRWPT